MQSIHFIQILSDIGAGKRGSHEGVKWLTEQHSIDSFTCFENHADSTLLAPPAKYIDNLAAFFRQFTPPLVELFRQSSFPIILSGDHSNAIGTISALCHAYPNKRIGVIWIDAHADLHTPYTTPSGNLHGMSLAALIRQDNQACAKHHVNSELAGYWQQLKQLAPDSIGIQPQDICFLGLRDYEEQEAALIARHNIPHYSTAEMRNLGFEAVFNRLEAQFNEVDLVYVSFDVDSLDSALLTATGTPVADGFSEQELNDILSRVLALPHLAAFEITEFNPTLSTDHHQHALISRLFGQALAQIQQRYCKKS